MPCNVDLLKPEDIRAMSYNELIGVVRETNRPPGGTEAIKVIAREAYLAAGKTVLEVGTSTGFSAVEIASLTRASVTAIDINAVSLATARARADEAGVGECVSFEIQDACNLAYPDRSFDLVLCGNVTSLLDEPKQALHEYIRVLNIGGFLAAIPMYYRSQPPRELVRRVSAAIGVTISPSRKDTWEEFFRQPPMEGTLCEDHAFDDVSSAAVTEYVEAILAQPHLSSLRPRTMAAIRAVYMDYMQLFRENLSYMGFSILVLRKGNPLVEPQLFTSHRIGGL